jgi:phosphoribosylformimino-5-aminoimidazole carboxamide ribotide isomerase
VQIIPVVDVRDSVAVHAVGGDRSRYRPVCSALIDHANPVAVAKALLAASGSRVLYVADLDAIETAGAISDAVMELIDTIDAAEIWLDAGVTDRFKHDCSDARIRPVHGTETMLPQVLAENAGGRPIVSLDYRAGTLLGRDSEAAVIKRLIDGPINTLIILDLADVGSQTGPRTLSKCRAIRDQLPRSMIAIGGGIRDVEDLHAAAVAGASAVLVATALHNLTLHSNAGDV